MLYEVPQIEGRKVYCGPTAISAVTGIHPVDVVEAVYKLRRSEKPIVGMCDPEVCNVLGYLGFAISLFLIYPPEGLKRCTLQRYFNDWRLTQGPCIASVTKHYVAIGGDMALCNQTKGKSVPYPMHPYARTTINSVIHVRKYLWKSVS